MERAYGVVFGQGERQIADGTRLGVAHGGSGRVANGMDGGLGFFAESDDEKSLGFQSGWGVQQYGFVGAGFVFATGEDGSGGGADGLVACEQDGHGLNVWSFGSLGIDGGDGEKFGFDLGEGEKESSVCIPDHYFIAKRRKVFKHVARFSGMALLQDKS